MNKNDSGNLVINISCFCKSPHCEGNLYIQPDFLKKQKCFMVSAIDTSGNDEANLWISFEQAEQLIKELGILLEENKKK
jgi:hypothetical protein